MNNIIRTKIILFIKILIYPISLTAKKRGAKKLSDLMLRSLIICSCSTLSGITRIRSNKFRFDIVSQTMITHFRKGRIIYTDLHAESNKCYARKQQGVYCLNEVSLHTYIRALQFISERSAGRGFVELLTQKVPPSERPCGAIIKKIL